MITHWYIVKGIAIPSVLISNIRDKLFAVKATLSTNNVIIITVHCDASAIKKKPKEPRLEVEVERSILSPKSVFPLDPFG